jgi:hypothetical protein
LTDETNQDHKEFRILRAMKIVLTGVVRDTAVPPGHKHPLSDNTIEDIRQCLMLISAREQELLVEAGEEADMVPRFIDEPQDTTVVPISKIGRNKKKDED